jgi:tetratricopeptide (TPR) repeat protein
MKPVLARAIVIGSALLLVVLLFFAPKKAPDSVPVKVGPVADIKMNLKLTPDQQKMYDGLKLALDNASNDSDKVKSLEGLSTFFEQIKKPLQVAVYYAKLAELRNTAEAWYESGERYYRAVGFVPDSLVGTVYQDAINSYGKSLLLDKNSEKAKLKMGVCYVELGSDPMKGVGLMVEVANSDPKNIDAQLDLGFFSVRSQQFDKALKRFNNVLQIDTGYTEAYVYLAQTYEMMGDTNTAVDYYDRYRKRVKDTIVSNQVAGYIKKLKRNKK